MDFLLFMKKHSITPHNIFIINESIFYLSPYIDQSSKIRISIKNTQIYLKCGNENAINLVTRPFHKKESGLMVSGGICEQGLGNLVFHAGNVNSFSINKY